MREHGAVPLYTWHADIMQLRAKAGASALVCAITGDCGI